MIFNFFKSAFNSERKLSKEGPAPNLNFTDVRDTLFREIHSTRKWNQRNLNTIKKIIVHHSAELCAEGEGLQKIKEITKYDISPGNHISPNGCPGIVYHWMIDRDGYIYKTSDQANITWHCKGQNRVGVGICLLGNFVKEKSHFILGQQVPAQIQLTSLDMLLYYLADRLNLRKQDIFAHREYCNTICPGLDVYNYIKRRRTV